MKQFALLTYIKAEKTRDRMINLIFARLPFDFFNFFRRRNILSKKHDRCFLAILAVVAQKTRKIQYYGTNFYVKGKEPQIADFSKIQVDAVTVFETFLHLRGYFEE